MRQAQKTAKRIKLDSFTSPVKETTHVEDGFLPKLSDLSRAGFQGDRR